MQPSTLSRGASRGETHALPLARTVENAVVGARITGARQLGLDRVAALQFDRRDRLGDPVRYHLIAELIGTGGNLVLLQGDEAIGAKVIERLREDRSRQRSSPLLPGKPYAAPPPFGVDATRATDTELIDALATGKESEGSLARALARAWTGVDDWVAAELVRVGDDPATLVQAWRAFLVETAPAKDGHPAGGRAIPGVAGSSARSEALAFRPTPSPQSPGQDPVFQEYPDILEAVAAAHRARRTRPKAKGGPVARPVRQAIKRTRRALEGVEADVAEAARAEKHRRTAEAILAAAHTLERGVIRATVADPTGGDPIEVDLDPKRDAAANAERYFKLARKAERSVRRVEARGDELKEKLAALEALLTRADTFTGAPTADWLAQAEALGVKVPRPESAAGGGKPDDGLVSGLRPRVYDLGDGWEILVGKSNKGNEVLTHEIARPDDTWMHVDHSPGSHVVLRHAERGKEPPREKLVAAASAAAFYSKARGSAKVSVLYTTKRHVRRLRGAPVGTVGVGQHKTIMVAPREPSQNEESR